MPTKALIPLPAVITPVDYTCYQFNVPSDVEWRAMLWGALDQLTRWNSYERSPGFPLGLAVANTWKDIVAEARDSECPAPVGAFPTAAMIPATIPGITQGYDNTRSNWNPATCTDNCYPSNPSVAVGWADLAGLSLRCETSLTFRDSSFNLVGTHVCQILAQRVGGFATWDFNLKWKDCFGVVHHETFAPPGFGVFRDDITAQWIWIDCNAPFTWSLTFNGPILCGPA